MVRKMSVYSSKRVFALIVVCAILGVVIAEIIRSGDILAFSLMHPDGSANFKPFALILLGISLAIIAYVIDTMG